MYTRINTKTIQCTRIGKRESVLSVCLFKKNLKSLQLTKSARVLGVHTKKIFLVDPNHRQSKINKEFLQSKKISKIYQYVAPLYKKNKIQDLKLLNKIKKIRPEYIIINIGGGVQEILGNYLKDKLNYRPSIICSGAAISFFTKQQAPITIFFDKIYLGWLIRIFFNPLIFLPRYFSAFKLFFLINDIQQINKTLFTL